MHDRLGSACAASVGWAWSRRDTSGEDPNEEVEHYVAALKSMDQLQTWYNASRLGLTTKMRLENAFQSCQEMPDALWNHLVRLHPNWEGDWQVFAVKATAFASSPRAFERFEACRATQGLAPWDWAELAPSAKKWESMRFFWERGFRPLTQWQMHWLNAIRTVACTPEKQAQEARWNAWMMEHVLPCTEDTPTYAALYPRILRSRARRHYDWTRPEKWRLMRDKMPWLHLAAAWHNDICWLGARAFHDPTWCDYAALVRLYHPRSFYDVLPDVGTDAFAAPLQATLDSGYAIGWTWPMLLSHLEHGSPKEESLALPGGFLDS